MNLLTTYKGLPKSMYTLFFAQIINRFGDFVMPFLTLLLVNQMGLDYQQAGFAVILATLSMIPGSFIGGKISDHIGRKKTYLIFQSTYALSILLCVFTTNPYVFIALICFGCFFSGAIRPIISAMITDILPPEKRKLGFSLSYLGINLGVATGPIVAGFLFERNIPLIFIGDALTSFLAVFLILMKIKETKPTDSKMNVTEEEKCESGSALHVLFRRPKLVAFLLIYLLFSMCYSQHSFSLPVMLNHVFHEKGSGYYGVIMSVNAITVLTMTALLTNLTRNLKPLTAIIMAGLLYAVGYGMLTFTREFPLFLLSTFIWSLGEILIVINFGTYIANQSPQNYRARFNAFATINNIFGSILSTTVMGSIMKHFSVVAVWPILFGIGILGVGAMSLLKFVTEKKELKETALIYED